MKELVWEESSVIPLQQSGHPCFGTINNQEEPVIPNFKDFNTIWLGDVQHFDCLELGEFILLLIKFVNVGTIKELSDNNECLLAD